MAPFRAACVQMRSSRSPAENVATAEALIREAAAAGAVYVQTPEMTNLLERDRAALFDKIALEEADQGLATLKGLARELGITLHIGSFAIRRPDGAVANRGFVIGPDGTVAARYDKIHMFDVDLANGESWRESATYQPGDVAVVTDLADIRLGLAICYDLRFPHLFRGHAKAGAGLLSVPAAFTRQTGEAHWHVLLRARAIENGAFVVAAAQAGQHEDGRETYGHSLIVDPWGRVLAEAATEPGIIVAEIDPALVDEARGRIPALKNERAFAPSTAPRLVESVA
ncbi:carbon-nitrogen hydrolase family protein [Segnochrobactrum spirostomi]|uniref:Carbon-nitrogen hydrolase family protein n=1 Tax=Segnochrobactrum spirostomi TaxID=2608987 RepID=A0A6A7Y362_9HYPH|nr:carbon-nitrogen hydrolase family protein [Segnochrobactrum spirostomi]MQT12182.1 carbon-nitrogen hydrolase family protein [Segnochrobactrum spirostomi]